MKDVDSAKSDARLVGLFALLSVLPLWVVAFPPLQDFPLHVSALHLMAHRANLVSTHLAETPYSLFYGLAYPFAKVLSAEIAAKLIASAAMILLPLSVFWFRRTQGLRGLGALLCIPASYSALFWLGLFPFLLGLPILFGGWAIAVRVAERGEWKMSCVLACASVGALVAHFSIFTIFILGCCGIIRRTHIAKSVLPHVFATIAGTNWLFSTPGGALTRSIGVERPTLRRVALLPIDLYQLVFDSNRGPWDDVLFVCLGILLVLGGLVIRRLSRMYFLPVLALVLFVISPHDVPHVAYLTMIRERFGLVLVLSLVAVLPLQTARRQVIYAGATAILSLVSIVFAIHVSRTTSALAEDSFGLVAAKVVRGVRVAALVSQPRAPTLATAPFLHWGNRLVAMRDATVQFSYTSYPHWPVRFREHQAPCGDAPEATGFEWHPDDVSVRDQLFPCFEHIVVRGEAPRGLLPYYVVEMTAGDWSLWSRREIVSSSPHVAKLGPGGLGVAALTTKGMMTDLLAQSSGEWAGRTDSRELFAWVKTKRGFVGTLTGANQLVEWGARHRRIGSGTRGAADGSFEEASFDSPRGVAGTGNTVFVADTGNHAIRKLSFDTQTISTFAAALGQPWSLCADDERVYVSDVEHNCVYSFSMSDGRREVVVGSGLFGDSRVRDGERPLARIAAPRDLVCAPGALYVLDGTRGRIHRIDLRTGSLFTVVHTRSEPVHALAWDGSLIYATSQGVRDLAGHWFLRTPSD